VVANDGLFGKKNCCWISSAWLKWTKASWYCPCEWQAAPARIEQSADAVGFNSQVVFSNTAACSLYNAI
jgi:hypothetical protein